MARERTITISEKITLRYGGTVVCQRVQLGQEIVLEIHLQPTFIGEMAPDGVNAMSVVITHVYIIFEIT